MFICIFIYPTLFRYNLFNFFFHLKLKLDSDLILSYDKENYCIDVYTLTLVSYIYTHILDINGYRLINVLLSIYVTLFNKYRLTLKFFLNLYLPLPLGKQFLTQVTV